MPQQSILFKYNAQSLTLRFEAFVKTKFVTITLVLQWYQPRRIPKHLNCHTQHCFGTTINMNSVDVRNKFRVGVLIRSSSEVVLNSSFVRFSFIFERTSSVDVVLP